MLFGLPSPVAGSQVVVDLMLDGWMERFGGGIEFEPDIDALVKKALAHIDKKRGELGLTEYDAARFGESGDRLMEELLGEVEEGELLNVYSVHKRPAGNLEDGQQAVASEV